MGWCRDSRACGGNRKYIDDMFFGCLNMFSHCFHEWYRVWSMFCDEFCCTEDVFEDMLSDVEVLCFLTTRKQETKKNYE